MKILHFKKTSDLSLLHDQLTSSIPGLRPVADAKGGQTPVMRAQGTETELWLEVPDTVDETAIAEIVNTHDPASKPVDQRKADQSRIAELLAVARSDWTSAQLRELLQLTARDVTRG
ncbi:MAG: hypothetical protein O2913_06440 [Chloroflexi bacterium]|nr:hypothetical protein [Chloroflexota bacterium]